MITYTKTSETRKATSKNEQASKFQDRCDKIVELTAKRVVSISNKVKAHARRIDNLVKTHESLKAMGLNRISDYSECFEDFIVNVAPIDAVLLAGLVDDVLQRNLDKCVDKKQEDAWIEYHKMNQEATLQVIKNQKDFYTKIGMYKAIEEKAKAEKEKAKAEKEKAKAEKEKAGTRTRKTNRKTVKA